MALSTKVNPLKISVIIPALNEEQYIAACVQSVHDQDFRDYEIIVVDNGSKDHTAIIARKMGAQVIREPIRGLPQARETGRQAAKGEVLVYLDADMIVPRNYLSRIYKVFRANPKTLAVSNPFTFHDGTYFMNILIKLFFKLILPFCRIFFRLFKFPRLIFGGNFAVRRTALDRINGFDTSIKFYGEDADLSKRLGKIGNIAFLPRLYTKTSARRYIKEGILRTNLNYILNYFSVLWCDHPIRWKKYQQLFFAFKVVLATLAVWLITLPFYAPSSQLNGKVIYQIPTSDKIVALTFDDGPNGEYTRQVLGILDQYQVKATFFLIGKNVETYPELARAINQRGHLIGNHSYSHPWRLPFKSRKAIWSEIIRAEEVIEKTSGQTPHIFRPPHGLRTPWMIKELAESDYTIYTWDDMTDDYIIHTKPKNIVKKILKHVHPGSIIVLHDGLNLNHKLSRANTLVALPIIIESLKKAGYKFVTLRPVS